MAGKRKRAPAGSPRVPNRLLRISLLVCTVTLLLTLDDRHAGRISDECQMVYTAVAMTETRSLGLSLDMTVGDPATDRRGEPVSRYGMASSFLQLPAALLAPGVERRLGPGTSGPLFLLVPILCVLAAGWASSRVATLLGGTLTGASLAVFLSTIASPLGSYGSMLFSEPLQAACLAGVLACSLAAVREDDTRRSLALAAATGAMIGAALLAKTVLLLFAAPLALPLLRPASRRTVSKRLAAGAAGFVPLAAVWLHFELRRFGALVGGYAEERFSHGLLDGLVRLTVFPDCGLLFFFPVAILAWWTIARLVRGRETAAGIRLAAAGAALSFSAMLVTSALWWCWHGAAGWGPRLLVPSVPVLAAFAALWLEKRPGAVRAGAVALCALLNLPPLLAHPALVAVFTNTCANPTISAREAAALPASTTMQLPDGTIKILPSFVLPYVPSAAPQVVYPWFAWASRGGTPAEVATRLQTPPWLRERPAITPPDVATLQGDIGRVAPRFRWGWGRTLLAGPSDPVVTPVYLNALRNQAVRLLKRSRPEEALEVSGTLRAITRSGDADAFTLESLRMSSRFETAADFVRSLGGAARSWPSTAAATALLLRDSGRESDARAAMAVAAAGDRSRRLARFARLEPARWPATLMALLGW